MQVLDHYPIVTTARLHECQAFYARHFGFETVFESSWFVLLQRPAGEGQAAISLAFMAPEHPSAPPGPEPFSGLGIILCLQVADARVCAAELEASGATLSYALQREAWGQLRFQCKDPSGLALDICEQIEPDAGFWEPYMRGDMRSEALTPAVGV